MLNLAGRSVLALKMNKIPSKLAGDTRVLRDLFLVFRLRSGSSIVFSLISKVDVIFGKVKYLCFRL